MGVVWTSVRAFRRNGLKPCLTTRRQTGKIDDAGETFEAAVV